MKLYARIAQLLAARINCIKSNNTEWLDEHESALNRISSRLPSGSGIDGGSSIDIEGSEPNRVIINTAYHHMNDVGMYDGWTTHRITITPDLACGIHVKISGPNRNDIKEMTMRVKIHPTTVQLWLSARDTYKWSSHWPLSQISGSRMFAEFDENGLVDYTLDGRGTDIDSNEFNAITSDHLRGKLSESHPAYHAAVGQFVEA